MSTGSTPHAELRAADADRDATARRLATALSEGRLDLPEYQSRLDSAMAAVTVGELAPLTTDLPADPSGPSVATAPAANEPVDLGQTAKENAPTRPKQSGKWSTWTGAAVIMIGIWLVTSVVSGEFDGFWPMLPLGIWAAVLLSSGGCRR
ncbi:hypothetical protein GCM10027570_22910 [Streptomonospora sediminis]